MLQRYLCVFGWLWSLNVFGDLSPNLPLDLREKYVLHIPPGPETMGSCQTHPFSHGKYTAWDEFSLRNCSHFTEHKAAIPGCPFLSGLSPSSDHRRLLSIQVQLLQALQHVISLSRRHQKTLSGLVRSWAQVSKRAVWEARRTGPDTAAGDATHIANILSGESWQGCRWKDFPRGFNTVQPISQGQWDKCTAQPTWVLGLKALLALCYPFSSGFWVTPDSA